MKYKYIILDFGNVLVTPTTGDWNITPKFLELVDTSLIDMDELKQSIYNNRHFLGEKLITQDEEYDMFIRYYDSILKEIKYSKYNKELVEKIAYDRTYNNEKYTLCPNIIEELKYLKDKYKLIMLTDNWPCVIPYLKDNNLYDFFDEVYISSVYGCLKKEKIFFDYPIKDYNIKDGEALFIDDAEINLDAAKEKGLDVLCMNRYTTNIESKYKIIHDLLDL